MAKMIILIIVSRANLRFKKETFLLYFILAHICPLINEEAVFQPSAGAALGYIGT